MVLRLKTRKSRSLPGLRKTECNPFITNFQCKTRRSRNGRRVLCLWVSWVILALVPKLPNADIAIIELTKLRDYCLSPQHPRGRHKAWRFKDLLGLTAKDADWLKQKLLAGVAIQPAEKQEIDSWPNIFFFHAYSKKTEPHRYGSSTESFKNKNRTCMSLWRCDTILPCPHPPKKSALPSLPP